MHTLIPLSSQMARTMQRHLVLFTLFFLLFVAATPAVSAQSATLEDRLAGLQATIPSLAEKFDEDSQRWSMSSGGGSMVYFYADTLRLRARTPDTSAAKLLVSESTLPADVMLAEVDVNFIEGGQNHGYGFYIRQGPQDYALFFISSNGLISVQRVTPESSTFVVPWRKSAAIKTENHVINHLSLLLENGHAVFFVNGTRVTDIKGARFHDAKLGLAAAMYAQGSVEVAFQDLRYWNLTPIEELSPEELKTRLTAAELTLADLPESFEAIPEDDLKIELDKPLGPGRDAFPFIVKSAFGYGNFYRMNIVIGTSGPINGSTIGLFDPKNVTNNQDPKMELLDLDRIGDESIAFTFTYVEKGETTRFDAELFRHGQVLAYIMVMYPEGTQPSVTLAEMVKIWDAHIIASLQGTAPYTAPVPIETPAPGDLTRRYMPGAF
jgi:hypothetical protein